MPGNRSKSPTLASLRSDLRFESVFRSIMGKLPKKHNSDVKQGGADTSKKLAASARQRQINNEPRRLPCHKARRENTLLNSLKSTQEDREQRNMDPNCCCLQQSQIYGHVPFPTCPCPPQFCSPSPYMGVPALFQGHLFWSPLFALPMPAMAPPAFIHPSEPEKPKCMPSAKLDGVKVENLPEAVIATTKDVPKVETKKRKRKLEKIVSAKDECKKPKKEIKRKKKKKASFSSSSNWKPVGAAERRFVYLNNDIKPVKRDCYSEIAHKVHNESLRSRDCVLVQSGTGKSHVAKIAQFFKDPEQNDFLMASLAWYYRPDQIELDYPVVTHKQELFASRHIDTVPVDCIEELCYVITYNEYCRYLGENLSEITYPQPVEVVARGSDSYDRREWQPAEDTEPDAVFFIRRVYDFAGKRLVRNPT